MLRRITEASLSFKLVNNYGPTENTVVATWGEVETSEARRELLPSGRPIYNAQVRILDRKLGVVPICVTGEIYIGGAGLARGYLNRADLSAARFISDPFHAQAGARLYKAGDLASYPGGWSRRVSAGRADEQVRLRGYRIGLAEIETALVADRAVREAVVIVLRGCAGAKKRLVGYIVLERQPAPTTSGLHLAS